jgi:outer membrane protein
MKKFSLGQTALISVVVLFTSAASYAKNTIAVVDAQAVWEKSLASKEANTTIKARREALSAELSKKQEELQKDSEELTKKRSALSAEAFEAKRKELADKKTKIELDLNKKKESLDKSIATVITTFQRVLTEVTTALAKEKEIEMVLNRTQILYTNPQMDITDEVLKNVNQKLPKIDMTAKDTESKAPAAAPAAKK